MNRKSSRKRIGILGSAVLTAILVFLSPGTGGRLYAASEDFQIEKGILVEYTGTDAKVSVPITVSGIGPGAFSGNAGLEGVTLPATIESIGLGAFENCGSLENVSIPEGCKSIGPSAFSGCGALSRVIVPASVERIGSGAFAGCDSLSDIRIHEGNPRFLCSDGALYNFKEQKLVQYLAGRTDSSYYMPASISRIESYAFWGADRLAYVQVAPYVRELKAGSFAECGGLAAVELPEGLKSIGAKCFQNCKALGKVSLPSSVGDIDDTAFDGCPYLELTAPEGGYGQKYAQEYEKKRSQEKTAAGGKDSLNKPAGSTGASSSSPSASSSSASPVAAAPSSSAVSSSSSGTSVSSSGAAPSASSAPSSAPGTSASASPAKSSSGSGSSSSSGRSGAEGEETTLGETKIVDNSAVVWVEGGRVWDGYLVEKEADWQEEGGSGKGTKGGNADAGAGEYRMSGDILAAYEGKSPMPQLPDGTAEVGSRAFYGRENVKKVVFSKGLEKIDEFAFTRSGLMTAKLPEGLKEIGYGAFYQCRALKEVQIPKSVEKIGLAAFKGTPWLEKWLEGGRGDFLVVGDGILLAYRGDGKTVTLPQKVKQIGAGCFKGNRDVEEVIFPEGLHRICEDAFNGCSSLKSVVLPDTLREIEDRAFCGCPLNRVVIPESVERIGLRAFDLSDAPGNGKSSEVVFEGSKLPQYSYNESAARLGNSRLRSRVFSAERAVVPAGTEIGAGTVLDDGPYGFEAEVADTEGNILKEALFDGDTEEQAQTGVKIAVELLASGMHSGTEAEASFDEAREGGYVIRVEDGREAKRLAAKALASENLLGTTARYYAVDISLYPEDSPVSITSLSGHKVSLKLPVPAALADDAENVRVMSVGQNGEFEAVPARLSHEGETAYIRFQTGHFSAFAFYVAGAK